jgi:hypothetical protein
MSHLKLLLQLSLLLLLVHKMCTLRLHLLLLLLELLPQLVLLQMCFLLAQLLLSVTQLLPLLVQFLPQLGLILLLQKQQL